MIRYDEDESRNNQNIIIHVLKLENCTIVGKFNFSEFVRVIVIIEIVIALPALQTNFS